jgi:hypothetical protein
MIGSSRGEVTKASVLGRAGDVFGLVEIAVTVLPRGDMDGEVFEAILCNSPPETDIGAIWKDCW